jgi:acyl-coenzyme A thioesterase PaaI-like protein
MSPSPWRRLLALVPRHRLFRLLDLYPPYLGAGVRVREVSRDLRAFTVEMRLRFWNRNAVGTHFGGSLYALADPWFMLILIEHLGDGYAVWDKAASIRFVRPGRGTVRARFEISEERIAAIRAEADRAGRAEPTFRVAITDEQGETVAEVEKLVSVRARRAIAPAEPARPDPSPASP